MIQSCERKITLLFSVPTKKKSLLKTSYNAYFNIYLLKFYLKLKLSFQNNLKHLH